MTRETFYKDYLRNQEDRILADRHWTELEAILENYRQIKPQLENTGQNIVNALLTCSSIHSINYRIKHEEHLLEKILRKMRGNPCETITRENYRDKITDLIGIRALHIFKEDWTGIHDYIISGWKQAEKPTAYVRYGDAERILQYYKDKECDVQEHKFGYRSVHYQLLTSPGTETYQVEVQVRTLYEEAWGEIDHRVRYPYTMNNEQMLRLSSILNRLSGNADELASYMRFTKNRSEQMELEHSRELEEKNRTIENLKTRIEELVSDQDVRKELTQELDSLGIVQGENHPTEEFPWLDSLMDSKFFNGLQSQLNSFMNSPDFEPIELSEEDWEILQRSQRELIKALSNPEQMEKILNQSNLPLLAETEEEEN
ncbi:MAG: RelA/SpoT domain-containing protein [Spirochaetales bacterium]|nr:RelA/SpoT domain-containing protein [Spirochaetales bacterium]